MEINNSSRLPSTGMAMTSLNRRRKPDARASRPARMRLGDNDRRIVRLVYDFRLLSQSQLERLMGRSSSTIQRLLRRLYDHGYLDRVFLPIAHFGSSPALYILDQRGMELLRSTGIEDFSVQPSRSLSPLFLEHTLAINDFRIAFTLACQRRGWRIERWLTEGEIKADYDRVKIPSRAGTVALVPDGYLTLDVPGRGRTHFFLELDRGTMTLPRFREKVEAYVAYYKTGAYSKRYQAQGFRVLTVVDGAAERRVNNLAETTAQVGGIGRRFWFVQAEQVTERSVLSAPVWYIAGQPGIHSLFAEAK
jgi:hypothetical protein